MEKIKWGIIGCGDVTEVKSGPAFNKVENSELVAVMRRNAGLAEDYAKRHNVPKWYSNADDLINDKEVNAVYIATPPDAHAELTIKALNAKKPVYVEKPMALNHQECLQMIKASEVNQTPLFVAYYRRALPGFLKVKELIEAGSIGKVKLVNMQLYKPASDSEKSGDLAWRVKPEIAGGGHFFDLASHQLDYFDFLFGPVQKIKAFALNQGGFYEAEDVVTASFLMPNDILINGSWSFTASPFCDTDIIEIIGDKGKISFSCFNFIPIRLVNQDGEKQFNYPKPEHVQQFLINDIVAELLGKGKAMSNGISGARTSWVMDYVVKEYYKNK